MDKTDFWKTKWFRVMAILDIFLVTILLVAAILEKYDDHFGIHPYSVSKRVVVATTDLPAGHTLAPTDLAYRDRNILLDAPHTTIPASVAGVLVGKDLASDVLQGRPIYMSHLALNSPPSEWPSRYEDGKNLK